MTTQTAGHGADESANGVQRAGEQAQQSEAVGWGVRLGLIAYGLVHLMLAFLALQLALGDRSGSVSSSGALSALAEQPFGTVLMWLIVGGMAVLVVWALLAAILGEKSEHGKPRWGKRLSALGKAGVYAVLALSAAKVALGSGSSGGGEDTMTARLMSWPAGQWLVVAVGLGIIGYGCYQIYRGLSEKFLEDIDARGTTGKAGTAYTWFGKLGHVAKGLGVGVVGLLFAWAGITHEAKKSGGLDQALMTVLEQPFGPYLVAGVGLGIGCYGLFCFARARHLSQ